MKNKTVLTVATTQVVLMIMAVVVLTLLMPRNKLTENQMDHFLYNEYEPLASKMCSDKMFALWNFLTDLSNETKRQIYVHAVEQESIFVKKYWTKYFKAIKIYEYTSEKVVRKVQRLKVIDDEALPQREMNKLSSVKTLMLNAYENVKICPYKIAACNLTIDGLAATKVQEIFSKSRDYDELLHVWSDFRNTTGSKMIGLFKEYVKLTNKAARANGFHDKGDLWRSQFEYRNFDRLVVRLWKQIEPLYHELHKYVGKKLQQAYPDKLTTVDLLPAHILGSVLSHNWRVVYSQVAPFPESTPNDIGEKMTDQKYTVLRMFEISNDFYKSLGLKSNSISYNTSAGAIIEKPDEKKIQCRPASFDMCDGKNYRIKMCARTTAKHLTMALREIAHVQYFLQYADQPKVFREAANPGFHEGFSGAMNLGFMTPKHLQKINLMDPYTSNKEFIINRLMELALETIPNIPFALIIDLWRWNVFDGTYKESEWNIEWWKFRKEFQKIKPPSGKSEGGFDPASIFHVAADYDYISYFFGDILQFQLFKSFCITAGKYDLNKRNLFECDFSGSVEVGKKISKGLSLGSSKHWSEVLEIMTGSRELDGSALLEFFQPLYNYLKEVNK